MGIQSEIINTEERKLFKKKLKKNRKSSVLESCEILNDSYTTIKEDDSPKTGKSKKRFTSVYPDDVDNNSESLENQRDVVSKLHSESTLVPSEDPIDNELVIKKAKKKKKSKDRMSLHNLNEPEFHEITEDAGQEIMDVDLPEEEIHNEEGNDYGFAHLEADNKIIEDEDFYDGWPKEDLKELFARMHQALPKNDSFKASSRLQKLDWEQIKFNNYSAIDCQEKWKYVEKKIRGFRLLGELLSDANDWLEKPWTDFYRSERKNRHPGMPKRPLTSFMLFYMDKKKKFAKKYPNLEMSKLSKIMAEKFHTLSENKREKYKQLAIAMREEYNGKMQKFLEEHPLEAMQIKKSSKVKKDKVMVSGPLKPVTPFKMFYQDKLKRLKEEDLPVPADFLAECKEKWKDMSNRKKMPWIRWAHEAEIKYLEEIKLYTAENPNFEAPPYKSVLSKAEKEILDRVEGKPEKPPNSAYSLFSRLMLKDPNIKEKFETPKQRLQEIARLWKEVPKIEREEYAEKVKHLLENYKLEYATYLDSLPEDKREEELASNAPKKKLKPGVSGNPKKKLRQTTLEVVKKTPAGTENSLIVDKNKRTKIYTEEELLSLEPPTTPAEPFILFRDDYLKKGLSEKKAIKAWSLLSDLEKRNYEQKLENAKKEYVNNYRTFLKSLKPEELKLYSSIKEKSKKEIPSEDEDDEVVEEEAESPTVSDVDDNSEDST
ncbi:nucleolar transcription factor 1-A [Halyomorpha halys]|uniref:nucleolar transcription factor 1-A n=1 Tax=Halyomorpha halys TaxID=286706 RepID=UPI0006D4F1A1|nr:nucleolar transcription factor 1-A-like [Halyomorpha halys]XP_014284047.1 nucleolar transcription factor 1-A-like [Halyomorpha halys]